MESRILKDNDKLKVNGNVVVRKEGDKYMLINIATQGLHFISPIAYFVVENINEESTVSEITSKFKEKFSVNDNQIKDQITTFIEGLIGRNLVSIVEV